jgi:hypothetical protein
VIGLTLEQGDLACRLVDDHSNNAEHLQLGGGFGLGARHHLIAGIRVGRDPIPGRSAKMKGHSLLWRLSATRPMDGIRQWFVDGLHQQTESRLLSVSETAFRESFSTLNGQALRTTYSEG